MIRYALQCDRGHGFESWFQNSSAYETQVKRKLVIEELQKIETPSFILPGNDSSHAYSASWALKELMPRAELWDVMAEEQNGRNTLEAILRFTS